MSVLELTLPVEPAGPAAAFTLTDAQVAELGGGRRAPVVVTVAGRSARLRVAVMGGSLMIGLSKAARAQLEVAIGDTVAVRIELDTAERTVEVPPLLARAFLAPVAAGGSLRDQADDGVQRDLDQPRRRAVAQPRPGGGAAAQVLTGVDADGDPQ